MNHHVHVIGPSGSGKSTAVWTLVHRLGELYPMHPDGAKKVVGHVARQKGGDYELGLIGRYDKRYTCGGVDTLKRDYDLCEVLARHLIGECQHVLSEGYLTEKQVGWLERLGSHVLFLRASEEECVMGIAKRRESRVGELVPGSASYYRSQVRSMERTYESITTPKAWTSRATLVEDIRLILEIP